MFISIILNTEYMDIASRSKLYLKNLLNCKENGWILITHEYMRTHWQQLQEEITPSLFASWEMQPFTADDVRDVEQYFIPDELFDTFEKQCGSRTEMLYQLSTQSNELIENVFQNIVNEILLKHHNETIDGIFHSLEAWQFLRDISIKNQIPLISYSFSALRKPHGYMQTLYHTNQNGYLHTSIESEARYNEFIKEQNQVFPIFTHKELIALFGKERTLPLIPLIDATPQYEVGICTECFSVIPQFFIHNKTTDDDIRYACEKLYDKSQIVVRNHSLQVDAMQLDRTTVHNDPAAWILSCKRLASARSQIMLKPLLWNRTAILCPNTLGFSFMCAKDYSSTEKVDLKALNWYVFGYLIPNDLMFSDSYWKWRMTKPTESEIYNYHLNFYIKKLNLSDSILSEQNEKSRFRSLLEARGCDKELVSLFMEEHNNIEVDYNTAISRIVVNNKSYWRLNKVKDGIKHFHIELEESTDHLDFYPLDDVAGFVKINSVMLNGQPIDIPCSNYKYIPKVNGYFEIPISTAIEAVNIDIEWEYMSNVDFLKSKFINIK